MGFRKGVSNSVYAVFTLSALIAGLMLLSNFGNPYSIAGQSNSADVNNLLNDQGKLEISKETASKASKYIDSQDIDTRSITQNEQLMRVLGEQISGMFSGKTSIQRQKGEANNTPDLGNISDALNRTRKNSENISNDAEADEGTESSSGQETESSEETNNSKMSGENSNLTEPNNNEKQYEDNETKKSTEQEGFKDVNKQNNTSDLRDKLKSGRNTSKDPEKKNTQSNGFLQELIKSIMSGFESGSTGETEVSQEKTSQQSDPNQETQSSKSQTSKETSKKLKGSGNLKYLAALIAALLLALLALMFYRSDKDGFEILQLFIKRLKTFVVSLPDLFRRLVVNGVSFIISRIKGAVEFTTKMLKKPVKTFKEIYSSITRKLARTKEMVDGVRQRSLRENIDVLLEKEEQIYRGLDKLWVMLKKLAGIGNKGTLTPAEVREKAINKGMSEEAVDKVVSAYRRKKYSSEKQVEEEIDVENLKKELEDENK